jgi:hypothetical protein
VREVRRRIRGTASRLIGFFEAGNARPAVAAKGPEGGVDEHEEALRSGSEVADLHKILRRISGPS